MSSIHRDTPEPFWQRLRAITLYPFRGAALASLVALTLASLLGMIPVVGWVVALLVWIGAYKYAFEVLRATADGRLEAPEVVLGTGDGVVARLIAMQLVFIVVVLAALLVGGPIIGLAVLALVAFMQPGCVMSLAMDGSLAHALNPSTPLALVGRIGWPYLAVFGLLFVIQASALTASVWLARWMPPVIADLAVTAVSFWGLFAAFHLMGYLIYQYHEALGYEPAARDGLPGRPAPDADLPGEAEAHVRDGHPDAAGHRRPGCHRGVVLGPVCRVPSHGLSHLPVPRGAGLRAGSARWPARPSRARRGPARRGRSARSRWPPGCRTGAAAGGDAQPGGPPGGSRALPPPAAAVRRCRGADRPCGRVPQPADARARGTARPRPAAHDAGCQPRFRADPGRTRPGTGRACPARGPGTAGSRHAGCNAARAPAPSRRIALGARRRAAAGRALWT